MGGATDFIQEKPTATDDEAPGTAENVRKQKPTGSTAASHSPSSLQQNLAKGL
jgi:hypothetical protein